MSLKLYNIGVSTGVSGKSDRPQSKDWGFRKHDAKAFMRSTTPAFYESLT